MYQSWKNWNGIVSKVMGSLESWLTLAKFGSSWLKIADLWHWTQMNSEKRKTIWIFWWFDYTKWLNQIDICLWKNTRIWGPFFTQQSETIGLIFLADSTERILWMRRVGVKFCPSGRWQLQIWPQIPMVPPLDSGCSLNFLPHFAAQTSIICYFWKYNFCF